MFFIKFLFILTVLSFSLSVKAEVRSILYTEALSFISPDFTEIPQKNFYFIGFKFKSNNLKSKNSVEDAFRIDLTGTYAVNKSVLSSFNLRELSHSFDLAENSQVHIGRRLQIWSALDTFWNYSIIQPVFKWNQLDPKNQGLTGVFYQYKSGPWAVTLYGSPIYIPDQGASFEIKDGQFDSGNPFFQPPPQNLKFQSQLLPIDYQIDRPKTEDIVLQPSFGAAIKYGENQGYYAQLAAFSKPANQLALGYKGVLVTTRVRVDVSPKSYRENIYAADFGYRTEDGFLLLSAVHDQPKSPEFDSSFNAPQFEASTVWGPQLLYKFYPFEFLVAYLDTTGGRITEVGPDVSTERKSLSERFLFKQAALLGINYSQVFDKQLRLDSSFQYKFSPQEGFRQIRFRNDVKLSGQWSFWLDLILIDTNSSINTNLENFKNKDQLWLGASYEL